MSVFSIDELTADRFCPVYGKEIGCELCCETVQVFDKILKIEAVPELSGVSDQETAEKCCKSCPYQKSWEEEY